MKHHTGGKQMSDHHPLDIWPLPREQKPMFINEPWLIDESIYLDSLAQAQQARNPEEEEDNRRVYIPLDLNKAAFLRRLDHIIDKYPQITWRNESAISTEVWSVISQVEIYDQIWFIHEGEFPTDEQARITGHSYHATEAVKEIIAKLEEIDTSEAFPYNIIDELKKEYSL